MRPRPILQHPRSEEHTSELQSLRHLVCRLLLEKTKGEGRLWFGAHVGRGGAQIRVRESQSTLISPTTGCLNVLVSTGADCFFFNDTATTEIYTLSLHDALPI